jgi:soluble lytic murein transglycosylase
VRSRRLRRRLLACGALLLLGLFGGVIALERTMPSWYARYRYPLHYAAIVRAHARNYHLDPALLAAVIYTESKFDASSRSSKGAVGLMQLLPGTAEGIAERTGGTQFVVSDLQNPEINIRYGAWYLEHLEQRYQGRPNSTDLALAAYNAGEGEVDRWIAETPPGGQVHIGFAETRAYVARVHSLQHIYRRAYAGELGYPAS